MNFFFGINNDLFKSELQIPLFQNRNLKKKNLKLFKTYPYKQKWALEELSNKKKNNYFYILKNKDIKNNEIFFLADETIYDQFDDKKLKDYNNFTNTNPPYRANFQLYVEKGGFSSFQSEYPYGMITKKGSIISSISSLANPEADENYILIKNIFENPIEDNFSAYLVNYNNKNIVKKFIIKTNYTNCIKIEKEFIKPEIFLITDGYLGIPMYASIKNNFLSFEHTHPPHSYISSGNRFKLVSNLKKELHEIIS
jgi:hypothetical protein